MKIYNTYFQLKLPHALPPSISQAEIYTHGFQTAVTLQVGAKDSCHQIICSLLFIEQCCCVTDRNVLLYNIMMSQLVYFWYTGDVVLCKSLVRAPRLTCDCKKVKIFQKVFFCKIGSLFTHIQSSPCSWPFLVITLRNTKHSGKKRQSRNELVWCLHIPDNVEEKTLFYVYVTVTVVWCLLKTT